MSVLVIDLGSKHTDLIVEKIREFEIYAKKINLKAEELIEEFQKCKAAILFGEINAELEEEYKKKITQLLTIKKPILGICSGFELISKIFKNPMEFEKESECEIKIIKEHPIVDGINYSFKSTAPIYTDTKILESKKFETIASFDKTGVVLVSDLKNIYLSLLHPVYSKNNSWSRILENFLFLICRLNKNWILEDWLRKNEISIKEKINEEQILVPLINNFEKYILLNFFENIKEKTIFLDIQTEFSSAEEQKIWKDYFSLKANNPYIKTTNINLDGINEEKDLVKLINEKINNFVLSNPNIKFVFGDRQGLIRNISQAEIISPFKDFYESDIHKLGKIFNLPFFIMNRPKKYLLEKVNNIDGPLNKEKIEMVNNFEKELERQLNIYQINKFSIELIEYKQRYLINLSIDPKSKLNLETLKSISFETIKSNPKVKKITLDITSTDLS